MKWLIIIALALAALGFTLKDGLLPVAVENSTEQLDPLKRSREVRNITTTVELLDPVELAERDQKTYPEKTLDQLITERQKSISIKLNLATAEGAGDIMHQGVHSAEAFKAQAFDLNFSWESLIELRCGDAVYYPVLSTLENTYGLTRDRNVMLVFAPSDTTDQQFYNSEDIKVVFRDDVFGTGTQHFTFQRADLNQASKNTSQ